MTGGEWAALGAAIRDFRRTLPLIPFETFGFSSEAEDPFEVDSARLRRIGGGVEALAFVDDRHSVYKFFLFREGGDVGATFAFRRGEEGLLEARSSSRSCSSCRGPNTRDRSISSCISRTAPARSS